MPTGKALLSLKVLCLGVLLTSTSAFARDVVPAEYRESSFHAQLPECWSPSVLGDVSSNFRHKESKFWNSPLSIQVFDKVREVAWRPWGKDMIPRRFCSGVAILSDGTKRRVDYSIREGLGFIGMTWNVQWCVVGTDRNYAYSPSCRAARP